VRLAQTVRVVCTGLVLVTGRAEGGGETAVRGTEWNGFVGKWRTVCYNTVTVFNKQRIM